LPLNIVYCNNSNVYFFRVKVTAASYCPSGYELVEEIYASKGKLVMKARRSQDDRMVVIKVLLDRSAESQSRQNREQMFLTLLQNTG
jgi:hypothetical protein